MGVPNGYTSAQVVQAVPTGIASALVCVKSETAFSAVSSISADSVFTSSYTNYLILVEYAPSSTPSMYLQFRASGSATTTNYNYSGFQMTSSVAQSFGYNASQSSIRLGDNGGSDTVGYLQINLYSPQVANKTGLIAHNLRFDGAYSAPLMQGSAGNQNSSTQFDGFIITPSTGTVTGSYTVYGYSKTV